MKNLAERGQCKILLDCKSRFSKIRTDWWNFLGIMEKEIYLTSQDSTINIRIIQKVICGDKSYTRQAIFKALNSPCKKRFVLKWIIENNPVLDPHYSRNNLVIKSNFPCLNHQVGSQRKLLLRRFKTTQASRR